MAVETTRPETAPVIPVKRARKRRRRGEDTRAVKLLIYALLLIGSVGFLGPWLWMVGASFKPIGEIFQYPPTWIPQHPTLDNFKTFLGSENAGRWFLNSAFVTITIVLAQTLFSSMAAYCFAKRTFPARDFLFMIQLGALALPGPILLVPNYLILKHVPFFGGNDGLGQGGHGWLDSYWGLIVPACFNIFSVFLLRQYMRTLPDELIDAAKMDGAGHFRIFWQVVMPLSRPAVAATAIFAFNFYWDEFLRPFIIITSSDHFTVPVGLALFVQHNRTAWDVVMAGSVLVTIPVLLAFIFFQRYFVRGIAISGLK